MNKKYPELSKSEIEKIVENKLKEDIQYVIPNLPDQEMTNAIDLLKSFFPGNIECYILQTKELFPIYLKRQKYEEIGSPPYCRDDTSKRKNALGWAACGTKYSETLEGLARYYNSKGFSINITKEEISEEE